MTRWEDAKTRKMRQRQRQQAAGPRPAGRGLKPLTADAIRQFLCPVCGAARGVPCARAKGASHQERMWRAQAVLHGSGPYITGVLPGTARNGLPHLEAVRAEVAGRVQTPHYEPPPSEGSAEEWVAIVGERP